MTSLPRRRHFYIKIQWAHCYIHSLISARIYGQKNRSLNKYNVLYSPICPVEGEACMALNIINRRERGTIMRQVWLVEMVTGSN